MKEYSSLFIIFALFLTTSCASNEKIKKLQKKGHKIELVDDDESIKSFALQIKNRTKQYKNIDEDEFVKLFVKWNPHIKGLKNIKDQYVYTSSPFSPYLAYQYAPKIDPVAVNYRPKKDEDLFRLVMGTNEKEVRSPADNSITRNLAGFFHITTSQGLFSEQIGTASVDNNQNSPITFGVGAAYRLNDYSSYSVSGSVYMSKLTASELDAQTRSTISNDTIEINDEIGANLYINKSVSWLVDSIYAGVDYERFSTLNYEEILNDGVTVLKTNQEAMTFATIGIGFSKKVFLPTTFKVSVSPTVTSNTNLTGVKYMLYANQKINNRFWYHLLFKQHVLQSGATDRGVTISRYGIGIGMAL